MQEKILSTKSRVRKRQKATEPKDESETSYNAYRQKWLETLKSTPHLMIPVQSNYTDFKYEYIPKPETRLTNWIRHKYLLHKIKNNKEIYYWDTRFYKSPLTLKIEDLMFASHVLLDHDGEPTHPVEAKHYKKLRGLYGPELDYFSPVFEAQKEKKPIYWDLYAQAYADQWIKLPYPEIKVLFHGMRPVDFFNYMDQSENAAKKDFKSWQTRRAAKLRWQKQNKKSK